MDEKGCLWALLEFVLSLNLHRRHLSSSQRGFVALDVLPILEKRAKERQGARTDIKEIIPESSTGQARDQIHNMNITLNDRMPPQQPTPPQKIDVHVHVDFPELPTGDEIGAGIVRQIQAAAQKQLTAQGHQVDWHVARDEQERLPGKVQPRLGNKRQEIVRR